MRPLPRELPAATSLTPVGFVDDDPRKRGMKDEHHLRVLGTTSTPT
jgi:hypothetical protein